MHADLKFDVILRTRKLTRGIFLSNVACYVDVDKLAKMYIDKIVLLPSSPANFYLIKYLINLSYLHGETSRDITLRKSEILDLEIRHWSVIENHWCRGALKSRNLCFLSIELETRELGLRPPTFALLPGCHVSRYKGGHDISRLMLEKHGICDIFSQMSRNDISGTFEIENHESVLVTRNGIMERCRDLISRVFSPCVKKSMNLFAKPSVYMMVSRIFNKLTSLDTLIKKNLYIFPVHHSAHLR